MGWEPARRPNNVRERCGLACSASIFAGIHANSRLEAGANGHGL